MRLVMRQLLPMPLSFAMAAIALVASAAQARPTYSGAGGLIPDNNATGFASGINVPDDITINSITVTLNFPAFVSGNGAPHTRCGDLVATIERGGIFSAPVTLFNRVGRSDTGTGDSSDMGGTFTFSDTASAHIWTAAAGAASNENIPSGSYRATDNNNSATTFPPNGPLVSLNAAYAGQNSAGAWILRVYDLNAGNTGGLTSWTLTINDPPTGACCYEASACAIASAANCLNTGGVFRGDGTTCASACVAPFEPFLAPPPVGSKFVLDQISHLNINDPALQPRQSQMFGVLSTRNIAYVDEFTITTTQVISRVDTIVQSQPDAQSTPPGGFLLSIWPSQSAAATDFTLQNNTIYDQGYTVPVTTRGGGEYEPFATVMGDPESSGILLRVNPAVSAARGGPNTRGSGTPSDTGLVLAPGTYYLAVTSRGDASWGSGFVLDSSAQDPRLTPYNAFLVNAGNFYFPPPDAPHPTDFAACYRVVGRNCHGDLNGDGQVNTTDLTLLLQRWGQSVRAGTGADIYPDGTVNTLDLILLLQYFGKPCS